MPSSRQVRMTRTAISPRLAIRTLVNMVGRIVPDRALGGGTRRRGRLHQSGAPGTGPERRTARLGARGRSPDRGPRPIGPILGGTARIVPLGLRVASTGRRPGTAAPAHDGRWTRGDRRVCGRGRVPAVPEVAERPVAR